MEISQRLVSAEPDSVSAHVAEIRRFVSEQSGNIHQLLNADVQRAKAEFAKHVTAIQMQRQGEGKKGHYIAIGEWNILGGYAARLPSQEGAKKRVRMVAGACFEAIHNALGAWLVRRWRLPKNGRRPVRPQS